ncbi:uncharacterized protein Z520_00150 [Fonsecaea multimorphosa CBS 102226]|uniref:Heterokaryon incompatibility domain-containing protein n=1 Tax=Fonsecaea multimorphosa CBS 102226 TaxID=1442371 RepID=A0A0D2L348_9EURO|nr:uncharacterized protein Z520_00150 [Fonsecaea multimorphosa CBS 102226]KIY03459.1 hypothetical protein Z520_00150 [Fonsecaea multimorphosa CBS 102226]OAL32717.1 hypothetical protein AYO22_00191 [Fonsecaea multimorphosa]
MSTTNGSPYVPLPHTGDFIRLLELDPGQPADDLVGRFVVHDLKDAQPEYTATSYVCGDDNRSHHYILMSGSKLGIYKNADGVLRRFRSAANTTYLWIDVVCIDQDNTVEKAREVNLMYKVYEKARRTVIWLGPSDDDAVAAIQYARTLNARSYLDEYTPTVMYAGHEIQYMQNKSHILDVLDTHPQKQSLINSCAKLLLCAWFTRVWTQQEGALSSNPVVVCGAEVIPWVQIFALAWLFFPRSTMRWPQWFLSDDPSQTYAQLESNMMFIRSIQRYRLRQTQIANNEPETREVGLINAMYDASRLKCYDPRDKIYAIRNIATDLAQDDWAPQPDYVTPWEDVYTDFAVRMADRERREVLDWSGVCQQQGQSGLPSWVVDWRSRPWTQYIVLEAWCAGGKIFRPKAERIPKKKQHYLMKLLEGAKQPRKSLRYALSITVMMQDTVAYLSGVLENCKGVDGIKRPSSQEVLAMDQKCQGFIKTLPSTVYVNSEHVLDAYNATLIANTTDQDTVASPSYVSSGVQEWRSWLSSRASVSTSTETGSESIAPGFYEAVDTMDTFQYKQFCVSTFGYFCLVPDLTEATDTIAIVKGLDMPIVLRPINDYYVYLGQCYIHGMMELQAGTLIEEFRVKFNAKEGKVVVGRPEGDVRKNGLKMDAGEYVRVLGSLGERKIELI